MADVIDGTTSEASSGMRRRPERVDLILSQLDQLPTLPSVATRVLQATTREDSSAQDVIELIESDQSLSAKVLKMVSSASTMARDVDTVEKAVVLLGFDAIRHAVLSIKIFDTLAGYERDSASHFDRSEYWKHSIAVACASHLIAERWPGHVDPEVAFVCGLLHDIGKIALDVCVPKSYDRIINTVVTRNRNILDVEQELLGVDHTIAGKRLAQHWKLPVSVTECIWLHHHTPDMLPDSVSNPDLVQIINLSNTWVGEQRLGFSGTQERPSSVEVAGMMGMPLDHLETVAPLLLDKLEERAALLGLTEMTPGKVFAKALSRVNLELGKLNEDLKRTNKRLEVRSQYLDLIHRFNCSMHSNLTLSDVCQVASEFARKLLRIQSACVFTAHPKESIVYAGYSDTANQSTVILGLDSDAANAATWDALAARPGLVVAPPETNIIRERLGDVLGKGPYWLLPICKDNEFWGGVLFCAKPAEVERLNHSADELLMFATALGLALCNGHERCRAERLNEGLAQVNLQLKSAQAQLLRHRSLAMIAEMAGGAAHELNNPLAVIAGRSELLLDKISDDKLKKDLKIITEQAHRCSNIVNELMAFAKPDAPQPARLNVPSVLRKLTADWAAESSLNADQIDLKISDENVHVMADENQFVSMLGELIKNAIEACDPQNARLRINCQPDVTDEIIVVTIEDNGCGMPKEVVDKSLDPFFSFKVAGRGRGLGLSKAVRWCEVNGGKFKIESQPDTGTKVWLEFPLSS